MKVQYFEDTDTLYIELRADGIVESRDLDENAVMDVDAEGMSARSLSNMRAIEPTCGT